MKRVGTYIRGSTDTQTTENQRRELEAVAQRSGWQVVDIYEDAGISGAKGRNKRPGLDRLLKDATGRKLDMIAAWSVDRLGRSLQDLVGFLTELQAPRCDLYLHQQALDTSTPSGRAMFQMLGVFAEFERGMIRERLNAGLARARAKGTSLGWGAVRVAPAVEARTRALKAAGMGILKIGRTLRFGELPIGFALHEFGAFFGLDLLALGDGQGKIVNLAPCLAMAKFLDAPAGRDAYTKSVASPVTGKTAKASAIVNGTMAALAKASFSSDRPHVAMSQFVDTPEGQEAYTEALSALRSLARYGSSAKLVKGTVIANNRLSRAGLSQVHLHAGLEVGGDYSMVVAAYRRHQAVRPKPCPLRSAHCSLKSDIAACPKSADFVL